MNKIIVNILLVMCVALPAWGKFAHLAHVGTIDWDKSHETLVTLQCDIADNDTVWSLKLRGTVEHYDTLLLKTGDGKVLELAPYQYKFDHETDSLGHNPITGELVEYYHHETVVYYRLTSTALYYIAEHGISKLRYGRGAVHHDKEFRHNEFGRQLTEAYRSSLEQMSPDYVPPRQPSVRDDF